MRNYVLGLSISCVHYVFNTGVSLVKVVSLSAGFLPTNITGVSKWVSLCKFNPPTYHPLSPTHFLQFSPVKKQLCTLYTLPISNNNYINDYK